MADAMFSEVFQRCAHIDGVTLKFDTPDEQHRQRIASKLAAMLQTHYMPEDVKEHERLFKVKVFNMTKDRSRCILKIHLYGGYALAVSQLPASIASAVFEMHFKAYASQFDDGAVKPLYDAIIWAKGGRQPTLYGQHPNPNSKKGKGVGIRVGDRNSDYGFVFYKRPSQRLGVELRIKDKAAFSRITKALDLGIAASWDDATIWATVVRTLQHAAATEFIRDLRSKGVDLGSQMALTDDRRAYGDGEEYRFTFRTDDDDDVKSWASIPLDL